MVQYQQVLLRIISTYRFKMVIIQCLNRYKRNHIYKQYMITEEVQEIFVERSLIVRQENIARRNYKLIHWLKLLTLHEQDKNEKARDEIIRNEIHQNFIMQEGFWVGEINKHFNKPSIQRQDIELLMLAIDDGAYHQASRLIADKVIELYKQKKFSENFCLSILEKFISLFGYQSGVGDFFKKLRQIYYQKEDVKKIRASFQREIKLAHDNFDLVWDQYKFWEKDTKELEKNIQLYKQAKVRWEREVVEFDQNECSQTNVKLSLFSLENTNQSKIDQKKFMHWLQKLPTQTEKLWFLRRIALNIKQLIMPYLIKLQSIYSHDQETLIKKYKVVIRISENHKQIQLKYLHFLVRRITKHLLNQTLEEDYNDTWSSKVVFFRQEITALIQKQRTVITPEETKAIFRQYYKLWIEVQATVIKDKDSVCQLYQNLIKQTQDYTLFQQFAKTLLNLGAPKQAKNVLKRYIRHANDEKSHQLYLRFIEMYGNAEDQQQYYKQLKADFSGEKKKQQAVQNQYSDKENYSAVIRKQVSSQEDPITPQQKKLKRGPVQTKDQHQLQVEAQPKKRIHVDGQNTVFIKGIPTTWTQEDVRKILLHPQADIAIRISLVVKNNQQRDYCYVQYSSKEKAEDEVKNNNSGFKFEISRPPSDYDQSSTLFLCALPLSANEQKIRQLFNQHAQHIKQIRLKLNNQKNYAYVEFKSPGLKEQAFQAIHKTNLNNLLIDGKKILIRHCDSSKSKSKKFSHVAFLKNIAFKTSPKDIQQFFNGKQINGISIPTNEFNRPKGFAYVEFENQKEFDQVLQMKKGVLHGREFIILRSDREITIQKHFKPAEKQSPKKSREVSKQPISEHANQGEKHADEGKKSKHSSRPKQRRSNREHDGHRGQKSQTKDNSYFSNLFK